jgi:hypothetical protein
MLAGVASLCVACSDPPRPIIPDPVDDVPQEDADPLDAVAPDAPETDVAGDRADVRTPRDSDGRCTVSADCFDTVGTPACDTAAGRCVRCTAAEDTCPADEHCDEAAHLCVPGCRADEGCNGGGDAGRMLYCNVATRACVACLRDEHCVRGYCENGGCVPWCEPDRGCGPSQTCCTRTCADLMTNPMHCGACGAACPAGPRALANCAGGTCGLRCEAGYADCNASAADGCEVDTRTSASNCGACGAACPAGANATPACAAGACTVACAPGFADCNSRTDDGCEVDTRVSTAHCGACNALCATPANGAATCARGACGVACDAGFADCNSRADDGCEVDTRASTSNCGACGAACPTRANATASCGDGACGVVCNEGFADCNGSAADGCEVNTRTSASNCGGCGTVCPSRPNAGPVCAAGACSVTCNAGFGNCNVRPDDGCEIDTRASNSNCGACGAICTARANANAACSAGVCRQTCVAPYVDCNGNSADGCETDVTADLANCGACGRTCGFLQGCAASDCSYAGLASYWAFNGNGNDAVGGRNLRIMGGLGFGGGVFGQGLNFTNNAAFISDRTVSDAAFDLSAGDFSLQIWVNFSGASTAQQLLVERGGGAEGWMFSRLADGSLEWRGTPSAVLTTTSITVSSGVWHHLVVRRRGTSFALYYDGASVASATTATPITATREALCVGRRYNGAFPLDGRVDELAIWSRALTDAEITGIYNARAGRPVIP